MILASSPLSPDFYVSAGAGGLVVLFLILFAETGLLVGFFLPGDTLLLLAGSLTVAKEGKPHLSFLPVAVVCILGAIAGAQVGFVIGRRVGPRLFDKGSRRDKLERVERLLHRVGEGKAVVAARFIPVVRTFMNPALGATRMPARDFAAWNVVGALLWVPPVLLIGRLVGAAFPLDRIVVGIVVVSLLLPLVELLRSRRKAAAR